MSNKRIGWWAQIYAAIGVLAWIGLMIYFKFYAIAGIIAVIGVPATIYNFVVESRKSKSTPR